MATKKLTIGKDNMTSNFVDIEIPEKIGLYNLSFTDENGNTINAGNFVVDGNENTYLLTLGLSNGNTINAGSFVTPIAATPTNTTIVLNNTTGSVIPSEKVSITVTHANSLSSPTMSLNGVACTRELTYSATSEPYFNNYKFTLPEIPVGKSELVVSGGFYWDGGLSANTTNEETGETTTESFNSLISSVSIGTSCGGFYFHKNLLEEDPYSAALKNAVNLKKIFIPSHLNLIPGKTFMGCASLTEVVIANDKIDNTIFTIGSQAFAGCPVANLRLPQKPIQFWYDSFDEVSPLVFVDNNVRYLSMNGNIYEIALDTVNKGVDTVSLSRQCKVLSNGFGLSSAPLAEEQRVTSFEVPNNIETVGGTLFPGSSTSASTGIVSFATGRLETITFEANSKLKTIIGGIARYSAITLTGIDFPSSLEKILEAKSQGQGAAGTIYTFGEDSNLKVIKGAAFTGGTIYLGNKLEIATGGVFNSSTIYLKYSESDPVPDGLFVSGFLTRGTGSKSTKTYNIYTDNTTVKDRLSAYADSYTTVNVYKYDGSAW